MDFNQLQESLIKAKAVMSKSDGISAGSVSKSSMPTTGIQSPNLPPISNNFNKDSISNVVNENKSISTPRTVTPEAVENSNLPEDIKKLMIEHPIPTVKFGSTIPDSLLEGAAEKMKSMGMSANPPTKNKVTQPKSTNTKKLTSKGLTTMIKKVVSESLDELIEQKIKSVISESKEASDSVQIVIGNTILEGKITSTRDLS